MKVCTAGDVLGDWLSFRLREGNMREDGGAENGLSDQDLLDGFQLTGLFLLRHVLEPRGQHHSDAREGFISAVTRQRAQKALTSS